MSIYSQWLESCRQADIPAITTDTAARIMAIVYLCANNENFTHNEKLRADIDYICKRWHIEGAESPDKEIVVLIRQYSKEIESHIEKTDREAKDWLERCKTQYPQWCHELIESRYNFKLFQ